MLWPQQMNLEICESVYFTDLEYAIPCEHERTISGIEITAPGCLERVMSHDLDSTQG